LKQKVHKKIILFCSSVSEVLHLSYILGIISYSAYLEWTMRFYR